MDDRNREKKPTDPEPRRWFLAYLLLAVFGVLLINQFLYISGNLENIPYSQFLEYVERGRVAKVTLASGRILGQFKDSGRPEGNDFVTVPPPEDPNLLASLREKGVSFRVEPSNPLLGFFTSWILPLFIFYLIWLFLFRRMSGGAPGNVLGFARSKARLYVERDTKTRFEDVAGADEAKEELKELVSFLQNPKEYTRLGGRAPKGILLVGPPGTGKTMLAQAVAGEAKVPFYSISGAEFVEMFVGLGAARVRDLFQQARGNAPCIIFIDEIDALGRSRSAGPMPGSVNDEREQTLNQLLAEMDGFDTSQGVIILAATNRPEVLDPALLRAGRFDRQILVSLPDKEGRRMILEVHSRKVVLEAGLKLDRIAALTPGFSGADLANLVNEAALMATRRKANAVSEQDFLKAIERIVAGLEQRGKVIAPEEKKRIAYHEMGHATVALSRNARDRVHKVSIFPRGMGALGYTLQRPTEDRYLADRREMLARIAILLGGRVSETIFFDDISTGAADDLAKATDLARAMITQYGMSEKLGPVSYEQRGSSFLQSPLSWRERYPFSERTAEEIDGEVKATLEIGFHLARESVSANRAFLDFCARRLLEVETLEEEEVQRLWEQMGQPIAGDTPRMSA